MKRGIAQSPHRPAADRIILGRELVQTNNAWNGGFTEFGPELSMTRSIIGSRFRLATLILFILSGLMGEIQAGTQTEAKETESPLKRLSLEQLGEIEVTSQSKQPVKISRIPAAIYVITQEDIRRSGATSIPELLRLAPGVEVARINSSGWAVGIRGFGSSLSRSVLVLIDGRSVYTPLFAGVYWNVQDTLIEDIDRIEVIRGPGGTIWGANAVNGVINIITKSSKDTQGTMVSAGGGNFDQGTLGFRYGGGNGKNFSYRIYGKGFTRGPEYHADSRNFDDWRMGQGGFRTDWSPNTRNTLSLQGDIYSGEAGERTGISTYSPPFLSVVEGNTELSGGNVLGRWHRDLGDGSDFELQLYYDGTNHRAANFAEFRNTFDVDFNHHLALPHGHNLVWGAGTRFSEGNAEEIIPTIAFIPNRLTEKLYTAFIQDDFPIVGDQLSFTVGAKLLHTIYTGFEIQPSARLLWTPNTKQTVWGSVTRAVRTPSRVDADLQITTLLAPNPLTFLRLTGDRQFSSEELVSYEVGYRGTVKHNLSVDISTFYNNYDSLGSVESGMAFFEPTPTPAHFVVPFLFRNGSFGSTTGFEIATDWKPTNWWSLSDSYAYLNMDLKPGANNVSNVSSVEGSSPRHVVVIRSLINLPRKLEFDQTYRFVSSLPGQRVGSYSTADLRFGWHFARNFELSLRGDNLLQPRHAEFAGGLVLIKRSMYAKITWQK